jgi:hypothetical protein
LIKTLTRGRFDNELSLHKSALQDSDDSTTSIMGPRRQWNKSRRLPGFERSPQAEMAESCHFREMTLPSKWNCARFAALAQVSLATSYLEAAFTCVHPYRSAIAEQKNESQLYSSRTDQIQYRGWLCSFGEATRFRLAAHAIGYV